MALPEGESPGPGGTPPGGGGAPGGDTPSTIGAIVFDQTVVKEAADSDWDILVYLNVASNDDIQCGVFITVDGVVRQTGDINTTFSEAQSKARTTLTIPAYLRGLSAGQHRVIVSVTNREPNDALVIRQAAILKITELKNAAK